jgi:hypothetical protein
MTENNGPLVAAVLTPPQQEAVDFFRALNVPASWFIGVPGPAGEVEVLALGEDGDNASFVWSITITAEGEPSSMEATVSTFSTGINV